MQQNHEFRIDVGAYLNEGWAIYRREPLLLSAATLLQIAVNALASSIPLVNMLLYGPLLAGLYILVMRIDRGDAVRFANYFDGFQLFLPLVLASVVTSLLITLGILFFILPGIYLALAYGFTYLNIVDGGMEFWPAMERSRKMITAHFWQYLVLALVFLVICILGAIPFGLGLLVAVPVCLAAQYCLYRDLSAHYGGTDIVQSGA
jgi:uncharacterized membrane protein